VKTPEYIKDLGFEPSAKIKVRPRIIISIEGREKQGKTHFALTAPDPIAYFSTDIGEEGVVEKFDKDIQVLRIQRPMAESEDSLQAEANAEWNRYKKAYQSVIRKPYIRSIVVDTATEMWEILRMARFGTAKAMPYMYGPVNREYRELVREAYIYDKNLILIHKMKSQYVNDKSTGKYERSGFSETGFLVQMNMECYRYPVTDGGEFSVYISDCRHDPELAGEELIGPLATFPMVASMIIPDADWGM